MGAGEAAPPSGSDVHRPTTGGPIVGVGWYEMVRRCMIAGSPLTGSSSATRRTGHGHWKGAPNPTPQEGCPLRDRSPDETAGGPTARRLRGRPRGGRGGHRRHHRHDVPPRLVVHGRLVAATPGRGGRHAPDDPSARPPPVRDLRGRSGLALRAVLLGQPRPQHRDPAPLQPTRRRAQEPEPAGRGAGPGDLHHHHHLRHRAPLEPQARLRCLPPLDPAHRRLVRAVRHDVDLPGHPPLQRTAGGVRLGVLPPGHRGHRDRHGRRLLRPSSGHRGALVRSRVPGRGRGPLALDHPAPLGGHHRLPHRPATH